MIVRLTKIAIVLAAVLVVFGASAYLTLTLLVKGEETIVVPDLVGRDVVDVLKELSNVNLNPKVTGAEFSDTIPLDHVAFQDPAPGTKIKSGRHVRIVLSKGAGTVVMSDLSGLSVQQAELFVEANGLCRGVTAYTPHPSVAKDNLIAHTPSPGVRVGRGGCVDLLISTGHRLIAYQMPNLSRLGLNDAVGLIERSNLKLGEITSSYRKDRDLDTVVDQDPPAGRRVTERTVVHLTVNRPPGKTAQIRPGARGFIRHRIQPGYLKRHIRVQLEGYGISDDLLNAYAKPGEEIWVLAPTAAGTTIRLYEDRELVTTRIFE